jgi:transcriptional regulator with XRE-family HTH domain
MPPKNTGKGRTCGRMLRDLRALRGMTKEALATEAGASARDLGLVEAGRARPSRAMLAAVSEVLGVPLRARNALFEASGFPPPYPESVVGALGGAERALRFALERAEPNPAFVVDRGYAVLLQNAAAGRLLDWLFDAVTLAAMRPLNLARMLSSRAMRPSMVKPEAALSCLVQRLYREAASGDEAKRAILEEVLAAPGVPREWRTASLETPGSPAVPLTLQRGALRLSFFATTARFAAPIDVGLEEVRIETYFAADTVTELALLRMGEIRG